MLCEPLYAFWYMYVKVLLIYIFLLKILSMGKKLRYRFVNCYSFKWHLYEWLFLYWSKYMCTEI